MAKGALVAGVEMGGTKCVCVLGDADGTIHQQLRIPTTTPDETLAAIEGVLAEWHDRHGFDRVGVASFGPIDIDTASPNWGNVLATTKPGWRGANVVRRLIERLGVPVALDTDVVGAALAEGRWGAALGLGDYAYVTVGTGVGVGVIAHGKALGGFGHAELGHIRVGRLAGDDWPGHCSFHGDCVEGLTAGPAIAARTGVAAEALAGDDPAWRSVAAALAGLLQTLIMTATPRVILMGGGVIAGNPGLLGAIRHELHIQLGGYIEVLAAADRLDDYVRAPGLHTDAGPLGSLAVALRLDAGN